jgi:chloramphenicol O-acetyltransferase
MEIPQVNSLYSYLYLKETKMSCFSFYLFSSTKSINRRTEQVLPRREGWHQWEGDVSGKRG